MKVKVYEASDVVLDYMVALCDQPDWTEEDAHFWVQDDECRYHPSSNWYQGGPIIEKEKISVEIKPHGYWMGSFQYNYADDKEFLTLGPTPLVAAMRCFVTSKLGDEVEVPEELL